MLKEFDIHIAQIVSQLHSIEKSAKAFLEKYDLVHDFTTILQYCMAKSKYHRVEGIAADKIGVFSEKANTIQLTDETSCVLYQEYSDILQITNDLEPLMWVDYEQFHNQVVIPKEKKSADAVVPAAINENYSTANTESQIETKKEEKPIIQSNFSERYDIAFKQFTQTHPWSVIIKDIHGALAKSNSDKDVKNEAKMTQIEKLLFGFEF